MHFISITVLSASALVPIIIYFNSQKLKLKRKLIKRKWYILKRENFIYKNLRYFGHPQWFFFHFAITYIIKNINKKWTSKCSYFVAVFRHFELFLFNISMKVSSYLFFWIFRAVGSRLFAKSIDICSSQNKYSFTRIWWNESSYMCSVYVLIISCSHDLFYCFRFFFQFTATLMFTAMIQYFYMSHQSLTVAGAFLLLAETFRSHIYHVETNVKSKDYLLFTI